MNHGTINLAMMSRYHWYPDSVLNNMQCKDNKAGFRKVQTTCNVHTTEDLYHMAEAELHKVWVSCNTRKGNQDSVMPRAIQKRESILQGASHMQFTCSKIRNLQDPCHIQHTNSKCRTLQRTSHKQTNAKYTISLLIGFLMLLTISLSLWE